MSIDRGEVLSRLGRFFLWNLSPIGCDEKHQFQNTPNPKVTV
jgi:hypothetical protein